jgi:hypothetical protein
MINIQKKDMGDSKVRWIADITEQPVCECCGKEIKGYMAYYCQNKDVWFCKKCEMSHEPMRIKHMQLCSWIDNPDEHFLIYFKLTKVGGMLQSIVAMFF